MQHFLPRDGVQHNSFILGAAFQAADGELFFGGINGFNQFYPSKLLLSKESLACNERRSPWAASDVWLAAGYTMNDAPQPQVVVALGLIITDVLIQLSPLMRERDLLQ